VQRLQFFIVVFVELRIFSFGRSYSLRLFRPDSEPREPERKMSNRDELYHMWDNWGGCYSKPSAEEVERRVQEAARWRVIEQRFVEECSSKTLFDTIMGLAKNSVLIRADLAALHHRFFHALNEKMGDKLEGLLSAIDRTLPGYVPAQLVEVKELLVECPAEAPPAYKKVRWEPSYGGVSLEHTLPFLTELDRDKADTLAASLQALKL
jgi:hypothetical protein